MLGSLERRLAGPAPRHRHRPAPRHAPMLPTHARRPEHASVSCLRRLAPVSAGPPVAAVVNPRRAQQPDSLTSSEERPRARPVALAPGRRGLPWRVPEARSRAGCLSPSSQLSGQSSERVVVEGPPRYRDPGSTSLSRRRRVDARSSASVFLHGCGASPPDPNGARPIDETPCSRCVPGGERKREQSYRQRPL